MKKFSIALLTVSFISLAYHHHVQQPSEVKQPKEVHFLKGNKKKPDREPLLGTIVASDGEQLAYGAYVPICPEAALVFYHGSGAHGGAGYTYMAEQLSKNSNIATYLFDMRGHGRSGGPRGHTPTPQQIWDDVLSAFNWAQEQYPNLPIFLGGHSGGAGMLLNYADWSGHKDPAGYLLVTPFLGKDVDIFREREKKSERPFARVNRLALFVNYISCGLFGGDWTAVQFSYPDHLIYERNFVNAYTVNMINALNAKAPLAALQDMLVPTYIFIADKDELFDPGKMDLVFSDVIAENSLIQIQHLADALHLTVLGEVDDHIGRVIKSSLCM